MHNKSTANTVKKPPLSVIHPTLHTLKLGGELLHFDTPQVMAILNVTHNSFYAPSQCHTPHDIEARTLAILDEGAHIIDIGACSTKPGSLPVTPEVELQQLRQAITIVRQHAPHMPLSIDTYRAAVAEPLLEEFGPLIINDISSGEMDAGMFPLIAKWQVPYILTHIQGTPTNMQQNPHYNDVVSEVLAFFSERINKLQSLGAANLIIDPGFGFGKTITHNYTLLRNLSAFHTLGYPILAGVSRKSMIYKILQNTPQEALHGTQTVNTLALLQGASILRVHDVTPALHAVQIVNTYIQQPEW